MATAEVGDRSRGGTDPLTRTPPLARGGCENSAPGAKFFTHRVLRPADAARETNLHELSPEGALWEPVASEPSPFEETAAAETVDLIASRLGDERQRQILAMHLGGYRVGEIANEVQLSERTVKRVLRRIRDLDAEVAGLAASGDEPT